jgi:hypothetical protein
MKKIIGALLAAGFIVAGFWGGIQFGWVGGIEEFIRGLQASPVDGGEIAWGVVRAAVIGDLIIAGGFVAAAITAAVLAESE